MFDIPYGKSRIEVTHDAIDDGVSHLPENVKVYNKCTSCEVKRSHSLIHDIINGTSAIKFDHYDIKVVRNCGIAVLVNVCHYSNATEMVWLPTSDLLAADVRDISILQSFSTLLNKQAERNSELEKFSQYLTTHDRSDILNAIGLNVTTDRLVNINNYLEARKNVEKA